MKTAIFAALAAVCVTAPALAQDAENFTGPRAGITMGYDDFQDHSGFSYGVNAGYDLALAPRIVAGVEVGLGDATTGSESTVDASRDLAASVRLGYAIQPQILAFTKVGYASSRFEVDGVGAAQEGVRYGGGLEYAVNPRTYISAEYARTEYESNIGGRDAGLVSVGVRF